MTMIRISFECETVSQLHAEMVQLLAGTAMPALSTTVAGATETVTEATPRTPRKKREGTQPPTAPAEGAEGNSAGAGADADASGASLGGAGAAPEDTGPVTKESLTAKAMTLAQKSSPTALAEVFGKFGVAKLGELPVEKYAEFSAELDSVIAALPAA
jgi:hypothetical protein